MPAVSDAGAAHRERAHLGWRACGGERRIADRSPERQPAPAARDPGAALASPVAFGVARRRARDLSRRAAHVGVARACDGRTAILETASTGYALVGDVDAARFCHAVADAADADDRVRALQHALELWNGPALEEFLGEEWADGEIARLTEIHAGTADDLADALIEARRVPPTRSRCSKRRSPATRTATVRAGC